MKSNENVAQTKKIRKPCDLTESSMDVDVLFKLHFMNSMGVIKPCKMHSVSDSYNRLIN